MKKSLKSLISILTIAMMLLTFAPASMAETTTGVLAPLSATITTFGTVEGNVSVLTDDFFYSPYDAATKYSPTASKKQGAALNDTTKGDVVGFTSTDSGIKWAFSNETAVKRIDLWILTHGGIGEYTVTAKNDTEDLGEITTGNLTPVYTHTNATAGGVHATYYPIVFPSEVKATEVTLAIDSFGTEANAAYISEARIYNTNEINLGEHGLFSSTGTDQGWSPYLERYAMSAKNSATTATTVAYNSSNTREMWPYTSSGVDYLRESGATSTFEGGGGRAWYATSLGSGKAKINKLTVNINGGNITKVTVHSRENAPDTSYHRGIGTGAYYPMAADYPAWTNVAEFSCNITKKSSEDDRTFEIPNAIASADIFIEFEYASGSKAEIMSIDMYALADYELTPYIKDTQLTGTAQAEGTLTFSADSFNNKDAKVFFAIYDEEDTLIHVGVKDLALSSIKGVGSVSYSIPATVTGSNLSAKAFLWDAKTLVPLLTAPVEQ